MFLTGSKVGLGTPWRRIRDLFGPPLGLESSGASVSQRFEGRVRHTVVFKPFWTVLPRVR